MNSVVLLGMGFGLGLSMLLRLLFPARPALAVALARVDAASTSGRRATSPRTGGSVRVATGLERRLQAAEFLIGEQLAGRLAERGLLGQDLRADLELLEVDPRAYTARKLLLAAGTLVIAPVVLTALGAVLGWSWVGAAFVSVLLTLVVLVVPDRRTRQVAARRRRDFTAATAAYLDLVAMRRASGSGIPEALRQAANIGSGAAFARIRRALDDAQLSGSTSGQSLTRLGEQLAVPELTQLGGQLQMMDEAGARAEASLRAKADALRSRQLTEAQGDANASSETMVIGVGLLGLGFLIITTYPALSALLQL